MAPARHLTCPPDNIGATIFSNMARHVRNVPAHILKKAFSLFDKGDNDKQVSAKIGWDRRWVGVMHKEWRVENEVEPGQSTSTPELVSPPPPVPTFHESARLSASASSLTVPTPPLPPQSRKAQEKESRRRLLIQYRKELRRNISIKDRARALAAIANSDDPKNVMVKMRALERIDEIDGLKQQEKEQPDQHIGPMFFFPPGSGMSFSSPISIPLERKPDVDPESESEIGEIIPGNNSDDK